MPRTRHDEPDEYDDESGNEYDGDDYDAETDYDPDDPETYPEGLYVDNERELVPCPHCRAQIDEESEQCPKCGMYATKEDEGTPRQSKSAVWIMLMVLALFGVLTWIIGW